MYVSFKIFAKNRLNLKILDVPPYLRRESVLCAILLMPDEHVEVLQFLLHFLLQIAEHSPTNQMNESNLALCFAPSLFHYSSSSFKQSLGSPHPKELAETRAGHDCLLYFLKNHNTLFKVKKNCSSTCSKVFAKLGAKRVRESVQIQRVPGEQSRETERVGKDHGRLEGVPPRVPNGAFEGSQGAESRLDCGVWS